MPKKRKVQQRFVADIILHDVLPSGSSSTSSAQPPSSAAAQWPDQDVTSTTSSALHCLRDSARTAGHSCLPAANPIDVQSTPCDPFDYVLLAATSVAGSSRSCLPIGPDHRSGPPRGCPDQSGDLLHRPLTVITECTRSWALAVRGA